MVGRLQLAREVVAQSRCLLGGAHHIYSRGPRVSRCLTTAG